MTIVYFKTTAPEVINAVNEFINKLAFIRENAKNFANEYGEKPAILRNGLDTYFAGLKWNDGVYQFYLKYPKSDWVFNKKLSFFYPRNKKNLETRKKWEELERQYHLYEHSDYKVSTEIILKSLGADFGDVLFSSFGWIYHNDTCYFGTNNISLLDRNKKHCHEITGSEYEKARKESENENK